MDRVFSHIYLLNYLTCAKVLSYNIFRFVKATPES
jgi:hypothetical protein